MKVSHRGTEFEVVNRLGWWKSRLPTWEPETFDAIDEFADPDSTFMDVGSWVGPMTLYAMKKFKSVYAYDPDPKAYSQLSANLDANGKPPNVFTLCQAAWTRPTILPLYAPASKLATSETNVHGFGKTRNFGRMEAFDLDNEIRKIRPRLLKLDVEGAEAILLPYVWPTVVELGVVVTAEIHHPRRWPRGRDPEPMKQIVGDAQPFDRNFHVVLNRP